VFHPYVRDPETLVREWALPGTPGLEHRIGGLEKAAPAGNISTNPLNHERMVHQRADRVAAVVRDIPDVTPDDPDGQAQVLVVGWGSTYGPIAAAIRRIRASGRSIAQLHLRHLNPLPANVGEVLHRYPRIVVPEMNLGQLSLILRARFLVDARSFSQVRGLPLSVDDLTAALAGEVDDLTPRVDASSRVNPTNSTAFAGQAQPVGQPRGRR
jgi:2-oxoglutarate ferredoxin oxidoreductase subunit alpha